MERDISSVPGRTFQMLVQWFNLHFAPISFMFAPISLPVVVVWMQVKCKSYWFEEEYVVYLHDNGYLLAARSTIVEALTTEVPEVVGKIDSLEKNLKNVKEIVGKNREGIGSCICLVCGCVNVTLFLVLAIFMVVAFLLK